MNTFDFKSGTVNITIVKTRWSICMVIHINKNQIAIIGRFCLFAGSDFFFLALYGYFTTWVLFLMSHLVWPHSLHAHAQHNLKSSSIDARIYVYHYAHSGWLWMYYKRIYMLTLYPTPGQSIWKWLRLPNVWLFSVDVPFSGYQLVGRTLTLGKSEKNWLLFPLHFLL